MPEGDAVWRTARRLHDGLAGAVLTGSDLRVPRLATVDLGGRATVEVVPKGKHLLHRVEGDLTVHSHLRMEGRWAVRRGSALPRDRPEHTVRAVLRTADVVAVGTSLGVLEVVRTSQEDRVVGHLGPDLLDPAYDRDRAVAAVHTDPRTITEACLDQRNVAGMGTIFTAEPLFLHGIGPWTPARTLSAEQVGALLDTARRLLVLSCRQGRTTVTGRADLSGDDGWVHGRVGLPCKRCGAAVRLASVGQQPQERVMFYCRVCQHGLAPTDDGARQQPLGHRATADRE